MARLGCGASVAFVWFGSTRLVSACIASRPMATLPVGLWRPPPLCYSVVLTSMLSTLAFAGGCTLAFAGGCTLAFASGLPRRLPVVLPASIVHGRRWLWFYPHRSFPDGGGLWLLYPHRLSPDNGGLWLLYPHRLSPDSGGLRFTLILACE